MFQIPLVTSSSLIPLDRFWSSILLYHNRPHIVNKKLIGVSPILFCKINVDRSDVKQISTIFRREAIIYETRKLGDFTEITNDFLINIIETYDKNATITTTDWHEFANSFDGIFVSIRILFGRTANKQCLELVIFDKKDRIVTFFAVQERDELITLTPQYPYHIELTNTGNLRIILDKIEDADTTSAVWIADKLFGKLLKWCEDFDDNQPHIPSLSLIDIDQYCQLYNDLKVKYCESLLKLWPENATTDPKKYIYEDIAIATYLICLWRKFALEDNIKFVDCGCGNGLLVYLLTNEGYTGCGIDVRRRKIWDIFENIHLQIGVVDNNSTFPDSTWIIGNHSDELTPWIPIIALKSSPQTNFFVLPCCPYDFNGKKYERSNSKISQYCDYMDYIQNISEQCKFATKIDKLRIPSTKRTCVIGLSQPQLDHQIIINKIGEFVAKRQQNQPITIRSNVEKVRNCTQLDRNLVTRLIHFTINKLLQLNNAKIIHLNNGKQWNSGGTISLNDLICEISKDDLKLMKNECGGMQTLLKNHRYLFEIKNGHVSMRKPPKLIETDKYKEKICWFLINHPDGCLYDVGICGYKH